MLLKLEDFRARQTPGMSAGYPAKILDVKKPRRVDAAGTHTMRPEGRYRGIARARSGGTPGGVATVVGQ